ncbi:MAG: hypothetical protein EPN47_07490 [Acidobacteria bacterium]|nr:MAG: hypothetical protein EPN47_07490 [Acidobacteriota bacterium]
MKITRLAVLRMSFGAFFLCCIIFCPLLLHAQYAGQDALASFPVDTQQIAYTNLATLRSVPQYPLIQAHLMSPQLRNLETLLQSAGVDPDQQVNELVMGWRGDVQDTTRFFGLAEGNFDPNQVHDYFVNNKMMIQRYSGYELYGFGAGNARTDMFFTFIDSSKAEFGRLGDLKALIDVRNASRPPLNSNTDFRRWEGDLDGVAPQWGISTGQAAANQAIPWLTQGKKIQVDTSALFGSVRAVLYRVDWSSQVMAHLSILCQNVEAANGFSQLLGLLRSAQPAVAHNVSPALSQILQNLNVQVDGSQLNLDASASISDLAQLLNAPASNQGSQ